MIYIYIPNRDIGCDSIFIRTYPECVRKKKRVTLQFFGVTPLSREERVNNNNNNNNEK